jgi:hypothetical protein
MLTSIDPASPSEKTAHWLKGGEGGQAKTTLLQSTHNPSCTSTWRLPKRMSHSPISSLPKPHAYADRQEPRLSITPIKCKHWTSVLLPRLHADTGTTTQITQTREDGESGAKKLAGLCLLALTPHPRQKRLPAASSEGHWQRRGFWSPPPPKDAIQGGSMYQAGPLENCIATKTPS